MKRLALLCLLPLCGCTPKPAPAPPVVSVVVPTQPPVVPTPTPVMIAVDANGVPLPAGKVHALPPLPKSTGWKDTPSSGSASRSRASAPATASAPRGFGITMAAFNRIETGMSYDEVVEIIGFGGTLVSESRMAGFHTVGYTWQNPSGSNMMLIFQNDRLQTKAQALLP